MRGRRASAPERDGRAAGHLLVAKIEGSFTSYVMPARAYAFDRPVLEQTHGPVRECTR